MAWRGSMSINPYAPSLQQDAIFRPQNATATSSRLGVVQLSTIATLGLAAITCIGRIACWIQMGWISDQWALPFKYWHMPHEYWLDLSLCALYGAVAALVTLIVIIPIFRQQNSYRPILWVYGLSAVNVTLFEFYKHYEMVEPFTDTLVGMLSIFTLSTVHFIATRRRRSLAKPQLSDGMP